MSRDTEELANGPSILDAIRPWEAAWSSACENTDGDIVLRAFLLPATDEWMFSIESVNELDSIPDLPGPVPVLFVEGLEQPAVAFSYTAESVLARLREQTVPESLMPAQE